MLQYFLRTGRAVIWNQYGDIARILGRTFLCLIEIGCLAYMTEVGVTNLMNVLI